MKIKLGDFVLTSTKSCFTLNEWKTRKNKDTGKPERFLDPFAHYSHLDALLDQYPQRMLMRSDAESIQALIKEFRGYTKEIKKALEIKE